ncbi:DUF1254 domain-containing protein [Ottowia sp.]|uniref:DUF1254 domain-containing protein n=1 Tax=Ottowia sp. TaxID=1898956 RepID=UPI0025DE0801|nr:DUF1254 domain-containing protein [Ottowia sp.]MBK6613877.1 DUF1254 domain-containing protein [Ottowia sp.]MBK6745560.1 DUF1254 domain-containing protein [Ottowia sp.]
MDRRQFVSATAGALASTGIYAQALAQVASQAAAPASLRVAARNAWIWGLPLIENAEQRAARFAEGLKPNSFRHDRALVTAKGQFVTTPNNDTLYSQAWLNLEKGPVTISVPASGERYYCVPLMDMYTNNFAIVGTRTSGAAARTFTVIGPNAKRTDPLAIRAPTNSAWILGRTLVDGDADLPKAHAFQDGWSIKGPAAGAPRSFAKRTAPWDQYFASVQSLMNESPPPMTDARMLDSMAPLIQFGKAFDSARYSLDQVDEIKAGVADAASLFLQIRRTLPVRNGWSLPRDTIGNFGQDYDYRAAVAVGGLAALPPVEAMYLRVGGPEGRGFDGAKSWKLTFAADQLPPVDSFWSLSMYRLTSDGQLFFADNPIDRYTIGDRTAGLKRGADGALDIRMSRTAPADANANWLPAPAEGNFVLILRAYLPKPALLSGSYVLPPVQTA